MLQIEISILTADLIASAMLDRAGNITGMRPSVKDAGCNTGHSHKPDIIFLDWPIRIL